MTGQFSAGVWLSWPDLARIRSVSSLKSRVTRPGPKGLDVFSHTTVFPLETRTFEEKQIFQEEQKTICAIIKPVLGIFF